MAHAHFPVVALLLALAAGPAQSVRNARLDMGEAVQAASEGMPKPGKTSKGVLVGQGWVCEDVKYLRRAKDAAEVKQYMTDRGLAPEYQLLKDSLAKAKESRWKPWDGAVLSKELSFGHLAIPFGNADLDVFLIVPYIYKPEYKLCFAQRNASLPAKVAENRYSDGSVVLARCYEDYKNMPAGTAAQSFDDKVLRTGPDALPAEVRKLLLREGAMDLHGSFAKEINGGDRKSLSVAVTTLLYEAYFQRVGLGVYYNHLRARCYNGGSFTDKKHRWFEYVDLHAVAPPYNQTYKGGDTRFPTMQLLRHLQCEAPPPPATLLPAIFRLRQERQPSGGSCAQVDQATPREHTEGACKCPYHFKVFCNGTHVAGRKFHMDDLTLRPECTAADIYCGPKVCKHNMYRTE